MSPAWGVPLDPATCVILTWIVSPSEKSTPVTVRFVRMAFPPGVAGNAMFRSAALFLSAGTSPDAVVAISRRQSQVCPSVPLPTPHSMVAEATSPVGHKYGAGIVAAHTSPCPSDTLAPMPTTALLWTAGLVGLRSPALRMSRSRMV